METKESSVNPTNEEIRKCSTCEKEMNITKGEHKVLMHHGVHRYVCSTECMWKFYDYGGSNGMGKRRK